MIDAFYIEMAHGGFLTSPSTSPPIFVPSSDTQAWLVSLKVMDDGQTLFFSMCKCRVKPCLVAWEDA